MGSANYVRCVSYGRPEVLLSKSFSIDNLTIV